MDSGLLLANVVALAKTAKLFDLPIVLSTVGVTSGVNPGTIPTLLDALPGVTKIDRTSINAWEDVDFVRAVQSTGRNKLILGALWTEVCLAFPALDALRAGYEVFPVVDAVAGTIGTGLGYFKAFPQDAANNKQFLKAGKLPMPVLVIGGEYASGPGLSEQANEAASSVRSVVLKGAGHWILEERPQEVQAAIVDFLQGSQPGR